MLLRTAAIAVLFSSVQIFAATELAVNVENFGAVANGSTDNTDAIQRAVASLHQGQTLYFPCTAGSYYLVNRPLNFGRMNQMSIAGSGPGCSLNYSGFSSQPYAFSFVGAFGVDIRNMDFFSASTGTAPQTVILLGRTVYNAVSGHFKFNSVKVGGYATKALVYSIASEENTYFEITLILNGGGALYTFYTSDGDDLGVAGLPSSSNLSVWMQNFHVNDYSSSIDASHALIFDKGKDSATGNHTYRDGYMQTRNGTGFNFNAPGGAAWMGLTVDSIRLEDGIQFFNFTGNGHFGDITLTNNKLASTTSKYMINLPTTCYNCTFMGNMIQQYDPATSVIGTLQNSFVAENHPMTIQRVINSAVIDRTQGTLQINSGGAGQVCNAAAEGKMRYLLGAPDRDGVFQVCQVRGGQFIWITK